MDLNLVGDGESIVLVKDTGFKAGFAEGLPVDGLDVGDRDLHRGNGGECVCVGGV